MKSLCGPALLVLGTLAQLGCGPVEYLSQVSSRTVQAIVRAERAEADRFALYEITMARSYYTKAREDAAAASFQSAIDYGRRSEEYAKKAYTLAAEKQDEERENAKEAAP